MTTWLASLVRDVDWWFSGRVLALYSVVAGSIYWVGVGITVYTTDETYKVKTVVQCFRIFNERSHSPVTGWPTSAFGWVTQGSAGGTPQTHCLLFIFIFSPPSSPEIVLICWTYHIALQNELCFERNTGLYVQQSPYWLDQAPYDFSWLPKLKVHLKSTIWER